jgi:general secretion pathway protein A
MYTEHFGLNEKPFSISPDPRYLYLSRRHADALAHLLYGISESGGFIQLTGEVGTGKTTLIRRLLRHLPKNTVVALILNPQLSTKVSCNGCTRAWSVTRHGKRRR